MGSVRRSSTFGPSRCLVSLALVFSTSSLGAFERPPASITETSIRSHMTFLASDAMNGRGSGTRDEWIAATYIASQMRQWGIEPLGDDGDYVQAVDVAREEAVAPPVLSVGNSRFMHGGEMLVQSIAGRSNASGPLVRYKKGTAAPDGSFVLVPDGVTADAADTAKASVVLTAETSQVRARWDTSARALSRS